MLILLLYFPGCPHVATARQSLQRAVAKLAVAPPISEIDVTDERTPEPLRLWGSPTILIDGVDVGGGTPNGSSCRLYPHSDNSGSPSDAMIEAALRQQTRRTSCSD
jgi:mercuric ion transport protein